MSAKPTQKVNLKFHADRGTEICGVKPETSFGEVRAFTPLAVRAWRQPVRVFSLSFDCRKLYKKSDIVGLNGGGIRRAVAVSFAAFFTYIVDYVSALRIGCDADGAQLAAAFVGAVARIYINMKRIKAFRAMVA